MAKDFLPVISFFRYDDFLDCEIELSKAIEKLQRFSAEQLLHFASKLCLLLAGSQKANSRVTQDILAEMCLREGFYFTYLAKQEQFRLQNKLQRNSEIGRVLFCELNLLYFMKIVLMHHNFKGKDVIATSADRRGLNEVVECYLAFALYVDKTSSQPKTKGTNKQVFDWITRSHAFHIRDSAANLFARYFYIAFVLGSTEYSEFPGWRLPNLFKSVTGLDLDKLFTFGYWTWLNRRSLELNTDYRDNRLLFQWSEYTILGLSEQEISEYKRILSRDPQVYRDLFLADKRFRERSPAFYLLPFQQNPLIQIDDDVSILTTPYFLYERTSKGIFWILDDQLKTSQEKSKRSQFQNYWRFLCQKYAETIFEKDVIPFSELSENEVFFDYQYGKTAGRATDIIVFDKRNRELFLFEVTDSYLNIDALTLEDSSSDFFNGTSKMVVEKASQIDKVIKAIRSSEIRLPGLPQSEIKTFSPILLFMTNYPVFKAIWHDIPGVWTGINSQLKNHKSGILQNSDTTRLRIISIEEMEYLGSLQRNKVDMFQVLRDWSNERGFNDQSLKNYLTVKRSDLKRNISRMEECHAGAFDLMEDLLARCNDKTT